MLLDYDLVDPCRTKLLYNGCGLYYTSGARSWIRELQDLDHAYVLISLVPRPSRGGREKAWYTLFAHACNLNINILT